MYDPRSKTFWVLLLQESVVHASGLHNRNQQQMHTYLVGLVCDQGHSDVVQVRKCGSKDSRGLHVTSCS